MVALRPKEEREEGSCAACTSPRWSARALPRRRDRIPKGRRFGCRRWVLATRQHVGGGGSSLSVRFSSFLSFVLLLSARSRRWSLEKRRSPGQVSPRCVLHLNQTFSLGRNKEWFFSPKVGLLVRARGGWRNWRTLHQTRAAQNQGCQKQRGVLLIVFSAKKKEYCPQGWGVRKVYYLQG